MIGFQARTRKCRNLVYNFLDKTIYITTSLRIKLNSRSSIAHSSTCQEKLKHHIKTIIRPIRYNMQHPALPTQTQHHNPLPPPRPPTHTLANSAPTPPLIHRPYQHHLLPKPFHPSLKPLRTPISVLPKMHPPPLENTQRSKRNDTYPSLFSVKTRTLSPP